MKKAISILLVIFMLFSVCNAYVVFTDETSYTTEEFQYVLKNSRSGFLISQGPFFKVVKISGSNPFFFVPSFVF